MHMIFIATPCMTAMYCLRYRIGSLFKFVRNIKSRYYALYDFFFAICSWM
jgi:hypothetical protein